MWTSLGKSIGDFVEERLTSPLISSFALAWAAVNYKFFVILFSKNTASETFNLIEQVCFPDWYARIVNGFAIPLLLALIYLFVIPHPAQWVYKHWRRNLQKTDNIKQDYENAKRLTVEESREYRHRISELESALDQSAANIKILRADLQVADRRASELESELSVQTELITARDHALLELKKSTDHLETLKLAASNLQKELSSMERRAVQFETLAENAQAKGKLEGLAAFQQALGEMHASKYLTEAQQERIRELLNQAESGEKDIARTYRTIFNILIRHDRSVRRAKISEEDESVSRNLAIGASKTSSFLADANLRPGIGEAMARVSQRLVPNQGLNPVKVKSVIAPKDMPKK